MDTWWLLCHSQFGDMLAQRIWAVAAEEEKVRPSGETLDDRICRSKGYVTETIRGHLFHPLAYLLSMSSWQIPGSQGL